MSIYVLRSRDLYKIGFSSNLGQRVRDIMDAVPGAVEFVGHMPGGMDVEAHLHGQFEADRFSGEWFSTSSRIEAFIGACLVKDMPAAPAERAPGSYRAEGERAELSNRVRRACAFAWPEQNHQQRILRMAEEIGWGERRARSVYHCERYTLLASEAPALDRWLAEWERPELASPTPTNTPTNPKAGDAE